MVEKKAQEYINEKYPISSVCKSKSDKENEGKKREQITILDLSKGKVGKGLLNSDGKTLTDSLKLERFTNLQKLIVSSQQLTSLDVSDCPNLKELDCQNNQIANLNVTGCSNLKIINCSRNNIKNLDFNTCNGLEEVDIINCPEELTENKNAVKSNLIFNLKKTKLIKGPLVIPVRENIRNILLVGWTGSGKSTLANSLTNTSDFKESNFGISETEKYEAGEFELEREGKKIKFRIIDNIGFGDTRKDSFKEEDVLCRIADGIHSAKEGINQILFVVKGKFSEEHIKIFNLFEKVISETGITKFTTIIKTDFASFRSPEVCERDKGALIRETNELRTIIESCNGILHVDNPSVETSDKSEKEVNKKKREKSREIVLDHLLEKCQDIYKFEEWDNIYSIVTKYKEMKEEVKRNNIEESKEKLEETKKSLFKELRVKFGAKLPVLAGTEFNAEVEVIKY